jgi:glycine cleavage system T protein (aminomethyltransferase)
MFGIPRGRNPSTCPLGRLARLAQETRSEAPVRRGLVLSPVVRVERVQTLLRTPLHGRHLDAGARMVPFAGWEMPVQYEGVIPEHKVVRTDAGVFDVSHMGQFHVEGPTAHELLQSLLSNDLDKIGDGQAQYTLLTNEQGGIVDDVIAYRIDAHHYLVVVNAGNREAAYAWMKEREIRGSEIRDASEDYALLAVQGPRSLERLELPPADRFTHAMGELDGIEVMVNRTGYTGEEGVELMCPAEDAEALWDAVLARGVVPCGLGARDTLRLEVCYPLHGNDITPETDPISASLGWACALGKEFTGVERIRAVREAGPARKLVAFVMEEKAIPRNGMPVAGGGEVTSGTHSPMLDKGIGMGYVPAESAAPGTELTIDVRGKERRATVVPKPIDKREE